MAGDSDPITPLAFSETIVASLRPNLARFERFADCGHGVVRDAPDIATGASLRYALWVGS